MNESPKQNLDQSQAVLKSLKLDNRRGSNWDATTFYDSYVDLSEQLAGGKTIDTLTTFYADAFYRQEGRDETDYEDKYSMSPPSMMDFVDWKPEQGLAGDKIIGGANTAFQEQKNTQEVNSLSTYGVLESVQYGPERLYRVKPNQFVFIPSNTLEGEFIIGSDSFSSCTAVIVKTDKGIFYSHVTTDCLGVESVVASVRKFLGQDQEIHIVRPKWEDESGEYTKTAEENEQRWQKSLVKLGKIIETTYPYITVGSKRKGDIHETAILVADDKVRTVGYYIAPGSRDFNFDTVNDCQL